MATGIRIRKRNTADTMVTTGGRSAGQRGFSLIEVVVAIGVLAGVLIAIGSMFVLGGRQVKTGRTITEATAMAQDIMESLGKRSFTALYTDLGAAASDDTRTIDSRTSGTPIAAWQAEIDRKLQNGSASMTVQAMGSGSPKFGGATGIKVTVTVSWNELGRAESVALSMVRF